MSPRHQKANCGRFIRTGSLRMLNNSVEPDLGIPAETNRGFVESFRLISYALLSFDGVSIVKSDRALFDLGGGCWVDRQFDGMMEAKVSVRLGMSGILARSLENCLAHQFSLRDFRRRWHRVPHL